MCWLFQRDDSGFRAQDSRLPFMSIQMHILFIGIHTLSIQMVYQPISSRNKALK